MNILLDLDKIIHIEYLARLSTNEKSDMILKLKNETNDVVAWYSHLQVIQDDIFLKKG